MLLENNYSGVYNLIYIQKGFVFNNFSFVKLSEYQLQEISEVVLQNNKFYQFYTQVKSVYKRPKESNYLLYRKGLLEKIKKFIQNKNILNNQNYILSENENFKPYLHKIEEDFGYINCMIKKIKNKLITFKLIKIFFTRYFFRKKYFYLKHNNKLYYIEKKFLKIIIKTIK